MEQRRKKVIGVVWEQKRSFGQDLIARRGSQGWQGGGASAQGVLCGFESFASPDLAMLYRVAFQAQWAI